jgi:acetyl esterase/lipase
VLRAVVAANVHRPVHHDPLLTPPSFAASLVVGEQAPSFLAAWWLRTAMELRRLRRTGRPGVGDLAGLALTAAASGALLAAMARARRSEDELHAALSTLVGEAELQARPRSHHAGAWLPWVDGRGDRRKTRGVVYADVGTHRLKLDVYEPVASAPPGCRRPAIMQIHGGAWVVGSKEEQGVPLLNHLARNGWVGFNVEYRLSPNAKFPTHLQDCKRALAWIREHADDYDIDPGFVAVTGGSAGGHLCALMALTAGDPHFQPGFEGADTTVQAAVPFYGVYDLTDRDRDQIDRFVRFLEVVVMGSHPEQDPEGWAAYSPVDRVHPEAPPMMLVHGSDDVLVPVAGARRFAALLRRFSQQPVVYAELTGAQHAFDMLPSIRTVHTVEHVERFLHHLWVEHLRGSGRGDALCAPGPDRPDDR